MVSQRQVGGAGQLPGSGRRVSRRGALGLVGRMGLGVGGAAAFGGVSTDMVDIGSTSDMRNAAEDPPLPTAEIEGRPHSEPVRVRYMTDHVSGPQGAAMKWGLKRFEQVLPNIIVDVTWVDTTDSALSQYFRLAETSISVGSRSTSGRLQRWPDKPAPHVISLSQRDFLRYRPWGVYQDISDDLAKSVDFVPEDYYHIPDTFTFDKYDHSFPQATDLGYPYRQPHFGLPFELSISGFLANISLAEDAGVRLPGSGNSWTWDDWTEWDGRMTDPETGTFGTWAWDDYAGQYLPQMYTNGLKKPFNDALTKTMFDQPEALEAWTYLIDKVFERKTSPTAREARELAGGFGNPFAAGKIGIWPTDRVGSTGLEAPRIKDRFTWTLLPEVVAPGGGSPGHSWSMRANLVTVGGLVGREHRRGRWTRPIPCRRVLSGTSRLRTRASAGKSTSPRSAGIGSAAAGGDAVAEGLCGPAGQPESVPVRRLDVLVAVPQGAGRAGMVWTNVGGGFAGGVPGMGRAVLSVLLRWAEAVYT